MIEAIEMKLEFDRSPEDIWRALADPAEIAGWKHELEHLKQYLLVD
jgi:uncharacterized protein YndB with AHSA1/START domain